MSTSRKRAVSAVVRVIVAGDPSCVHGISDFLRDHVEHEDKGRLPTSAVLGVAECV